MEYHSKAFMRILLLFFLCVCTNSYAQLQQRQYHLYENEFVLNPAVSTTLKYIEVHTGARFSTADGGTLSSTYVSVASSIARPKQSALVYNDRILRHKKWHGLGFYAYRGEDHFNTSKSINASYGYDIGLPMRHLRFSTGVRVGLQRQFISYPDDINTFTTLANVSKKHNAFDLDFGGLLYHRHFSVGFGIENASQGKIYSLDNGTTVSLQKDQYITASFMMNFWDKSVRWNPFILYYTDQSFIQDEIQLSNQLFWDFRNSFIKVIQAGILIGNQISYQISLGININYLFTIGYQYTHSIGLNTSTNGVSIQYKIRHPVYKKRTYYLW